MTALLTDLTRRLTYGVGKLLLLGGFLVTAVTWPAAVAAVVLLSVLAFLFLIWAVPRAITLGTCNPSTARLATNLAVGPEWVTLTLSSNLQTRRQKQEIAIHFPLGSSGITRWNGRCVGRLPDGTMANLEVQLLDDRGVSHTLRPVAGDQLDRPLIFEWPRISRDSGTYVSVRVRSNRAFTSPRLEWWGFDLAF